MTVTPHDMAVKTYSLGDHGNTARGCVWGSCLNKSSESISPFWSLDPATRIIAHFGGQGHFSHPWILNSVFPDEVAFQAARQVSNSLINISYDGQWRYPQSQRFGDGSSLFILFEAERCHADSMSLHCGACASRQDPLALRALESSIFTFPSGHDQRRFFLHERGHRGVVYPWPFRQQHPPWLYGRWIVASSPVSISTFEGVFFPKRNYFDELSSSCHIGMEMNRLF